MKTAIKDDVRRFLLKKYEAKLQELGIDGSSVPDSFDFLLEGVVDSLGLLEMIGAIEMEYEIELDMEGIDPESTTLLGPLAAHVASQCEAMSE